MGRNVLPAAPVGAVALAGGAVSPGDVVAVARHAAKVELTAHAVDLIRASRARVEAIGDSEEAIYGVSTGFGALATTRIEPERRAELQEALIRSHAAGMGPPVDAEVVRAMMLLRARTLAMGYSGARPELAEALLALLNAGVTPLVPRYGSLGASGDLAPLAHVGLCLLGEGRAYTPDGGLVDAAEALRLAELTPMRLSNKDGLALINGTDGMLAMLVLACADFELLLKTADITAAMSVEALLGTDAPFTADLHRLRPHPGQGHSAANLVRLLAGSGITASHRESDHAVQDSYSLRCSPQVAGAARDTLEFARAIGERELASAIDNPVVLRDGSVKSNGNFHGAPLGYALDFLAIASADLGSISERRTDRLLDESRSRGLPAFLSMDAGVNSGLMMSAYTAAALLSENRRLAVPASVDSATTSAMQEDHVSMGWNAGLKLRDSLRNLARILAVELLAGSVGLYFRRPLEPAAATAAISELVLGRVGAPGPDRFTAPELETAEELIRSGAVLAAAEEAVGPLE